MTTTIYTDATMTAVEALEAIASVASSAVADPRTANAHVPLPGATARVHVSKFGDEVPVSIDIDGDAAEAAALGLAEALRLDLGWDVSIANRPA